MQATEMAGENHEVSSMRNFAFWNALFRAESLLPFLGILAFIRLHSPTMKYFCLLLLGLCGLPVITRASDLQELVTAVKATTNTASGINEEEQEIAGRLQKIGAEAIPSLLPLLHDKNPNVRALAAYTLRDIGGLTEEHLEALMEACRKGEGWLPPAIARIGTSKAITFLVEELVRQRQTYTQFTGAISMLGEKAVPQLLQVYQDEKVWDDALEQTMLFVFKDLGPKAEKAIDPLLKLAGDEAEPHAKRSHAIRTLGVIGLRAERTAPFLQKLLNHQDREISDVARSALLTLGTVEAAPLLVQMLMQTTEPFDRANCIRDIAGLKTRGASAGSAVTGLLKDKDWDVRAEAARALGLIGCKDAVADLIPLLSNMEDWRLVMYAAESLGRLRAKQALPALAEVAEKHWHLPVKQVAKGAMEVIHGTVNESAVFPSEGSDYSNASGQMEMIKEDEADLVRFAVAKNSGQPVKVSIKGEKGIETELYSPAVEVEGGYIVGADNGEWGGSLAFIDRRGDPYVFSKENIEAIYKTPQGFVAIGGLAHMGMNRGVAYRVKKQSEGAWSAEAWRMLPGAPLFSRLLEDGSVFISCLGGIVQVFPDGSMKSLTRGEAIKPGSR